MENLSTSLYQLFTTLKISTKLPIGIEILNPYDNPEVLDVNKAFFNKYYNDRNPRILLLGINPGRLGAGLTGIGFTDPYALENNLGIANSFSKQKELSATFVHQVIEAFGGAKAFFSKFLISAVSPLGYIKNGININYYDQPDLEKATTKFISETMLKQHSLTGNIKTCVCIGQGKNLKYLQELNKEHKLFDTIHKLGHPRWVMQYKRKELDMHINTYVELLKSL